MTVQETIHAYYGDMLGEHHRYRSWEHCYRYFHGLTPETIAADRDHAALQLAFYLASWGMYRGSGFLLQHAYTVHLGVIDRLVAREFTVLWEHEFGGGDDDSRLIPVIMGAVDIVREAYRPFAPSAGPSDTLVTKIILGTFGCLPACDRYFIEGFKSLGCQYSYLNSKFVDRVQRFCKDNLRDLREEQNRIEGIGGMRYPLMKLVDMYFWQTGSQLDRSAGDGGSEPASGS